MTQYERELSNLSYTNKDFGAIYPELLDLVKKISYKWDPSTSDESDPGVVLLKLAALMADKNNYNIDKNILELFPLSVTQDINARQIFEQCGYRMKYFQGATTTITLEMIAEPEIDTADLGEDFDLDKSENARQYKIPKFTMVSDPDNNFIYTITQEVLLSSTGLRETGIPVIQGVVTNFNINGDTLITSAHLDYNNRLYFTENNIAENGIFITHNGLNNYNSWKAVDNLLLAPIGDYCYKFGLTEDGSRCYIEFPSDIHNFINEGLNISYIQTNGLDGNIGANRLCQFYTDVKAERTIPNINNDTAEVTITSDNIYITNPLPAINGQNPETINDAYKNYEKIKNTFDTLVSLSDYTNYIYTAEEVSNGYACDRTNDPQSTYKILETKNSYSKIHTKNGIDGNLINEESKTILNQAEKLSAFDLRLYGFNFVGIPTTAISFINSFTVLKPSSQNGLNDMSFIEDSLKEIKSIQHDFKEYDKDKIFMIKNKYPLQMQIIPQYTLDDKQQKEVIANIYTALYKVLNSRMINFGDEVDYDLIYTTVTKADSRIKVIILQDIDYESYAIYWDGEEIRELRIDGKDELTFSENAQLTEDERQHLKDLQKSFRDEITAKSILAGKTQFLDSANNVTYSVTQQNGTLYTPIEKITTNTNITLKVTGDKNIFESDPLQENENVIFTAPNLIQDKNYSNYVKFLHNIKREDTIEDNHKHIVVSKDTDYYLQEREFIIFFWKEEDDESAPYKYVKYSGNDSETSSKIKIINPNFNLKCQPQPGNEALENLPLTDALNQISQWPDGEGYTDQVNFTGTSLTPNEYIAGLYGSNYVLSGTNSIITKKENIVEISDKNIADEIYWILNKTETGADGKEYYTLFEDGITKRILDTNETIFYTNKAKTQFITLGTGTKITRNEEWTAPWSVEAIDYETFYASEDWRNTLEEYGTQIPSGGVLKATEMVYYQIGPEHKIRFVNNDPNPEPETIIINNSGIIINNKQANTLENYTISYSKFDEDSQITTTTNLPIRNNSSLAWEGYSVLNINSSPTKPQELQLHQSITLYPLGTDSEIEIKESDSTKPLYYILTNREINMLGGENLDVTTIDISNPTEIIPLDVYCYKKLQIADNQEVEKLVNYHTYEISVTTNNYSKQLSNIKLPIGNYLLPLEVSKNIASLKVTIGGTEISPLFNRTVATAGQYLFPFIISETDQPITIEIEIGLLTLDSNDTKTTYQNTTLTINPFYKYTDDANHLSLIPILTHLDRDLIFDYLYQVPEEDLIEDPLVAKSFVDANHILNPFTICEWNIGSKNNKTTVINRLR